MDDLIEALTILRKYMRDPSTHCPTLCEHDMFAVDVDPADVTEEDLKRLCELSFEPDYDMFSSTRFGSC